MSTIYVARFSTWFRIIILAAKGSSSFRMAVVSYLAISKTKRISTIIWESNMTALQSKKQHSSPSKNISSFKHALAPANHTGHRERTLQQIPAESVTPGTNVDLFNRGAKITKRLRDLFF